MLKQRGICVLVAAGGCGRGIGELPLQDAAQSCWLARQGEGSVVTLAVDVPSPARAAQTNSPPFPWLTGITRSGNAHVHPCLCPWSALNSLFCVQNLNQCHFSVLHKIIFPELIMALSGALSLTKWLVDYCLLSVLPGNEGLIRLCKTP